MSFLEILKGITRYGIREETPPLLASRIIMANRISLLLALAGLLYFFTMVSFMPEPAFLALAGSGIGIINIILNRYGHHRTVRFILSTTPVLIVTLYHAMVVPGNNPPLNSLLFIGFIMALTPWLLSDLGEKRIFVPSLLIVGSCFLLLPHLIDLIDYTSAVRFYGNRFLDIAHYVTGMILAFIFLMFMQVKNLNYDEKNEKIISLLRRLYQTETREHRSTLKRLEDSQSLLQQIFTAVDRIYLVLDREGNILESNPTTEIILEVDPTALKGRNLVEIHPWGSSEKGKELAREALDLARRNITYRGFIHFRDTEEIEHTLDFTLRSIQDADGGIRFLFLKGHEITERLESDQPLVDYDISLNRIIGSAPLGIGIARERIMVWGNQELGRLLRYRFDQLEGKSVSVLYPDKEEFVRVGLELYGEIAKKGAGSVTCRMKRGDGTIFDAELHGSLADPGNPNSPLIIMVTDITDKLERERELVRLNEELNAAIEEMEAVNEEFDAQNREMALAIHNLEESEERFRSIADNLMDGITVIQKGKAIYVNKRMTEILGYSREELLTMPRFNFAAPEELERLQAFHKKALEEQQAPGPVSFWIIRKDGARRFVQNRYRIRFNGDGNITWFAVTTDLTDEIKAEEERNRLITAIEQSEEDIIITDTEGTITYVNPAFERNTGYTRKEALGNSPSILKSGQHDDSFYEHLWLRIRSGRVWSGRIINRKKNGQLMVQSGTISPIRDRNDVITGFVSIKRDVTSESRLEDQLVQAQKMEAIGTLAGGLAHDFNNLLGGILGATNLIDLTLKKGGPEMNDRIRGFLDTIKASSRRAADMIRQLLTLSRKDDASYVPVDLNSSLRHIEKLAKNSFPKSVTLRFNYQNEPVIVHADPTQIEQVILNICLNSSHAMTIMRDPGEKPGGILTVDLEKHPPGSLYMQEPAGASGNESVALIRIKDTGIGMDEETRAHAFDPFFTTKDSDEGTGLGLAMAYTIVKRHSGVIEIESEPSFGTTVNILLPVDEESREPFRSDDQDILVPGSGHLLVIDDETIVLSVTTDILKECGYEVTGTSEPESGIEFFRENREKLEAVILDMSMPHISGLDVYRELKTIDARVPVLVASGYAHDERVQKVLNEGAASFLQKPFTSHSLSESVAKVIRERTSR